MRPILYLILFLMVFLRLATAQATGAAPLSAIVEEEIFNETILACRSVSVIQAVFNDNSLKAFLISTGQSLSLSLGLNEEPLAEIDKLIDQKLFSDYTFDRLRSVGFAKALVQCFPNDQNRRNWFVESMAVADALGKVPGILSLYYMARSVASVRGFLLARNPKVMRVFSISAAVVAATFVIYESYRIMDSHKVEDEQQGSLMNMKQHLSDDVEKSGFDILNLLDQRILELKQVLAKSEASNERENIEQMIFKLEAAKKSLQS